MNKIGEFLDQLQRTKENVAFNSTLSNTEIWDKSKKYYKFELRSDCIPEAGVRIMGFDRTNFLISLDDEDLEYFKSKYSKQLFKEQEVMIQELEKEKNMIINKYKKLVND